MNQSIKIIIRKLAGSCLDTIVWWLAIAIAKTASVRNKGNEFPLIVPAGELDGGFGEDIMIASLISEMGFEEVAIFSEKHHRRDEIFPRTRVHYFDGFQKRRYINFIRALNACNQVYIFGADVMDGAYGEFIPDIRFKLNKLGKILGKKVTYLAFSLSENIPQSICKQFQKLSTSQSQIFPIRDEKSAARMIEIVDRKNVISSCDIAFLGPIPREGDASEELIQWRTKQAKSSRGIIAVCPNAIQAKRIGIQRYIEDYSCLLEAAADANHSFMFLYHDLRPQCDGLCDKDLSELLYVRHMDRFPCYFPPQITDGVQVKSFLLGCSFSLTGRMHLGISGLTIGVPMFGISYQDKFEGVQTLFEIPPSKTLIDFRKMPDGVEILRDFIINLDEYSKKVECKIALIKDSARNYLH